MGGNIAKEVNNVFSNFMIIVSLKEPGHLLFEKNKLIVNLIEVTTWTDNVVVIEIMVVA